MNRKIDQKRVKQVVTDSGLHQIAKIKAAKSGTTIRSVIENVLAEILAIENNENEQKKQTNTDS